MRLGLEWIISVTLSLTNIPHLRAKVSFGFYKSVKSAIGSCNIPKNYRISDFVKTVTRGPLGVPVFELFDNAEHVVAAFFEKPENGNDECPRYDTGEPP